MPGPVGEDTERMITVTDVIHTKQHPVEDDRPPRTEDLRSAYWKYFKGWWGGSGPNRGVFHRGQNCKGGDNRCRALAAAKLFPSAASRLVLLTVPVTGLHPGFRHMRIHMRRDCRSLS